MAAGLFFYYITDRGAFPGNESARRERLLDKIAEAAHAGVDYIQLREKDLPAGDLESLASEAMHLIRQLRTENRGVKTRLLINSRTDIALAAGADGVHLRSGDISSEEVRAIWKRATGTPADSTGNPTIAVSCHSSEEVARAAADGANFAVFGPVFEKSGAGSRAVLDRLPVAVAQLQARHTPFPVLALGGITTENAGACLQAGAAGIAAIRLFQGNNIAETLRLLRNR
jgi:thiamine-phosphate pyrophosphorylase